MNSIFTNTRVVHNLKYPVYQVSPIIHIFKKFQVFAKYSFGFIVQSSVKKRGGGQFGKFQSLKMYNLCFPVPIYLKFSSGITHHSIFRSVIFWWGYFESGRGCNLKNSKKLSFRNLGPSPNAKFSFSLY